MRILHSDNLMIRRYGHVKVSTGRRLFNGMIRNNWKVCEYSERDIAKFEAPLGIKPLGIRAANRRFIETFENFKPDAVLMGHSDLLTNETLKTINCSCRTDYLSKYRSALAGTEYKNDPSPQRSR